MKARTFDAILAERDPKRFGNRFRFCGEETILNEHSPFQDELVASDFKPPKYWSVVALAPAPRPQIVDVNLSMRREQRH